MRVINRYRWHRAKIGAAIVLFLIALICIGGLETTDATKPFPSVEGFITAMLLLSWLTIHLIKEQGQL